MIQAKPEAHDFKFPNPENPLYAIGFQDDGEMGKIVFSKLISDEWKEVDSISWVRNILNRDPSDRSYKTPEELFITIIEKANKALQDLDNDGLPDFATGSLKELMLLIRDNLKYENGKLERIH